MVTKTEVLKHKRKIIIEYQGGSIPFTRIDLDKVFIRVFLKDGTDISQREIKEITISVKP